MAAWLCWLGLWQGRMSGQEACAGAQLLTSWQSGSKEKEEGASKGMHVSVAQLSLGWPHF